MKLKRTTPEQMFAIVRDFWVAWPGALSGESQPQRFFVVPRYNAVLRADPGAIHNFFSFMSLGGSVHAAVIKPVLQAACHSRLALKAALRAGYIHSVCDSSVYPGVRWDAGDALVAQWQFVGCFSLPHRLVAHCLADPRYAYYLQNEIEARREVARIVPIPQLRAVHMEWPSGWTERIIRGRKRVRNDDPPFAWAQAGMLQVYQQTRQDMRLLDYLDQLAALARERYAEDAEPRRRIEALLERVKSISHLESSRDLWVSRCHGDLGPEQVVVDQEKAYLVDWCGSEATSVFHDLIYSALFRYGWRDFEQPVSVPVLEPLRQGLNEALQGYPPALTVGLVLAEMGVKEYVDYGWGKGRLKAWSKIVDHYLESTRSEAIRKADVPARVSL